MMCADKNGKCGALQGTAYLQTEGPGAARFLQTDGD